MNEQIRQLLNELPNTAHGQALGVYLHDQYDKMNDVNLCTSWEDTRGRQIAIKMLEDIFKFMKPDTIITKTKNPYT